MALNIEVFDGQYRITSDEYNVIVEERYEVDPTKSPKWKEGDPTKVRVEYRKPRYYPTVEAALIGVAESKVRMSDATTLEELAHEIRQIRREISDKLSLKVETPSRK